MASNQSGNPQAAGRLELLLIVGVVICTTSNLLLSMSHRVMDQVAVNSAGPTVGLDFWQNLPEDVLELERRIEVQGALLEQIVKLQITRNLIRFGTKSNHPELTRIRSNTVPFGRLMGRKVSQTSATMV